MNINPIINRELKIEYPKYQQMTLNLEESDQAAHQQLEKITGKSEGIVKKIWRKLSGTPEQNKENRQAVKAVFKKLALHVTRAERTITEIKSQIHQYDQRLRLVEVQRVNFEKGEKLGEKASSDFNDILPAFDLYGIKITNEEKFANRTNGGALDFLRDKIAEQKKQAFDELVQYRGELYVSENRFKVLKVGSKDTGVAGCDELKQIEKALKVIDRDLKDLVKISGWAGNDILKMREDLQEYERRVAWRTLLPPNAVKDAKFKVKDNFRRLSDIIFDKNIDGKTKADAKKLFEIMYRHIDDFRDETIRKQVTDLHDKIFNNSGGVT